MDYHDISIITGIEHYYVYHVPESEPAVPEQRLVLSVKASFHYLRQNNGQDEPVELKLKYA